MAGETILIVEDRRENIVHLANNVLKPNGYQVITAMDGQRGLMRALAERPDLIIMDLNMPKMDGLEVLAALQEREVDIPVILSTFYGSEQVAQQAMRLGAAGYVVKPFGVGDMLKAVQRALAGHSVPLRPVEPVEEPAESIQELAGPVRELTEQVQGPDEPMPLTRQVERWMRDMNILNRIGKALVAQLDMEKVCSRAVEAIIYITRADHAFLFLVERDIGTRLLLCAMRGLNDRHVRFLNQPIENGLAVQVARTGKTTLQPQADKDTFLADMTGGPLGPLAAVPFRWQGETSGVLIAARGPKEPTFSESDVEWLNGLADYVAIAVRNARAFEQCAAQPPRPAPDRKSAAALRQEMDQFVTALRSATEMAQRLAERLSPGDEAPGAP